MGHIKYIETSKRKFEVYASNVLEGIINSLSLLDDDEFIKFVYDENEDFSTYDIFKKIESYVLRFRKKGRHEDHDFLTNLSVIYVMKKLRLYSQDYLYYSNIDKFELVTSKNKFKPTERWEDLYSYTLKKIPELRILKKEVKNG